MVNINVGPLGEGQTIVYEPSVAEGELVWDCSGGSVTAKMRPPRCRP